MKILVLNGAGESSALAERLPADAGDITLIHGEDSRRIPKDPALVDVIVGEGDCSPGSALNDLLLGWRTHPHTYLVPCWVPAERKSFHEACIWPSLSIDRYGPDCDWPGLFEWVAAVSDWQQNRMHFDNSGILRNRGSLELITSLCLRRASGVLSIFDDGGAEGRYLISEGKLHCSSFNHLRGIEALFELLCLSGGGYAWESNATLDCEGEAQSLVNLITEGLRQIHDANLVRHFFSSFGARIERTSSESALDDSATHAYPEQKVLYNLIEKGISVERVLDASPLSRPTTMGLLAKWISLEDVAVIPEEPEEGEESAEAAEVAEAGEPMEVTSEDASPLRVLVVDDSPLMCRALERIFSSDPRLEVTATAHNGLEALEIIDQSDPDVVTLDLQMPKMDGLSTLKHIQIRNPKPVVVLSAFTRETSRATYESFKFGAVDVLTKPENGLDPGAGEQDRDLCDRVVRASNVQMKAVRYIRRRRNAPVEPASTRTDDAAPRAEGLMVVLCGAGGFSSLLKLVFAIGDPGRLPPTLVAMAMPRRVVEALAFNLQKDTTIPVEVITGPTPLRPRRIHLLASDVGGRMLREGDEVCIQLDGTGAGRGFFDRVLGEASECFGARVAAVLLSGTGEDGIDGMRRVLETGGSGFALTLDLCLRPDLPKIAITRSYAKEVKTITDLAGLFDAVLFDAATPDRRTETCVSCSDG